MDGSSVIPMFVLRISHVQPALAAVAAPAAGSRLGSFRARRAPLYIAMERRYLLAVLFAVLAALLVGWPASHPGEGETGCPLAS